MVFTYLAQTCPDQLAHHVGTEQRSASPDGPWLQGASCTPDVRLFNGPHVTCGHLKGCWCDSHLPSWQAGVASRVHWRVFAVFLKG